MTIPSRPFLLLSLLVCLLHETPIAALSAVAVAPPPRVNVIAGASGYIGKSVVRESVLQGYETIALVRSLDKIEDLQHQEDYQKYFKGAKVIECDVTNPKQLNQVRILPVDSALAS